MSKSPHRASDGATGAEDHSQQKRSTRPSAQLQSEKNPAVALRQTTDEAACRFLQLILPEEGPYIAWIKESNEQKYNVFMSTISQLWVVIKRANDAGDAVYHACANFHEARHDPVRTPPAQRQYGRTKRNVRGAKALWLDIDAGPDKSYANAEKAWQAVLNFCRKANLPSPLIVWSGNGLHVYWPLQLPLDRGTWERQAHGLKALCITRFARRPQPHHRHLKRPAHTRHAPPQRPGEGGALWLDRRTISDQRLSHRGFGPAFGAVAADHCGQLAEFRDKQGQIPEPVWYAGLGVLAHCADGDQLGHDWSRGDPRYTERETQERLDRARQFGPTTCKRFRDLSPAGCRRCPWSRRINSPIALGGPLIAQGRRR
jgi:hypothetical protein